MTCSRPHIESEKVQGPQVSSFTPKHSFQEARGLNKNKGLGCSPLTFPILGTEVLSRGPEWAEVGKALIPRARLASTGAWQGSRTPELGLLPDSSLHPTPAPGHEQNQAAKPVITTIVTANIYWVYTAGCVSRVFRDSQQFLRLLFPFYRGKSRDRVQVRPAYKPWSLDLNPGSGVTPEPTLQCLYKGGWVAETSPGGRGVEGVRVKLHTPVGLRRSSAWNTVHLIKYLRNKRTVSARH